MTHLLNVSQKTRLAFVAGLLTLTAGLAHAQAPRCFILAGTYAGIATETGPQPFNVVTMTTFDGAGKWSSIESANFNGQIVRSAPLSGTYTLKTDCSGTIVANFPNGSTGTQDLVLANGGKTIYAIGVDAGGPPGGTLTTIFTRQETRCSVLADTYAGISTATGPFPFNTVAIQTFEGAGKWSTIESANFNGQIVRSAPLLGTYTLNPDCSGTMTAKFPDGSTGTQDFVVANGGKTIYAIGVDAGGPPGTTLTTIFTRMN